VLKQVLHPLTRMMVLSAASARDGKGACLAKPSFTSQATLQHGLRLPSRPDTAAARLELAIG
jgi:hypothetical protein